jgi:hypothetical protein
MKTQNSKNGVLTPAQKAFSEFLEASEIRHGWTPYSNDTLRAQMLPSKKPRHRVFAWLVLNSWGAPHKSAVALYGNRPARNVDVAKDLAIEEKHVSKLVAELVRDGWVRIRGKAIAPEGEPKMIDAPEPVREADYEEIARKHYLAAEHTELVELRELALALWNECRKLERAAVSKIKTLPESEQEALLQKAKTSPVPEPRPVVLATKMDGTNIRILTSLITNNSSLSRVAGAKASEAHPETDPFPAPHSEEENKSQSPATQSRPDPDPSASPDAESAKADKSTPPASPSSFKNTSYEVSEWFFIRQKQALVQKAVEHQFGFKLKPTDPLLSKFVQLAADNRVTVDILTWWMTDLKRAKQKARYRVESAGAILNFGKEDFAAWVERNKSKIDDAMRQQVEVPPTEEEVITVALHLAEGPEWLGDDRREEWILDLEQFNQERVARVRAEMKVRGEL